MNADLSLVHQSDSSACPARSLQNVPVRPPIAQSTPSFFCTFLRISQKISISPRLRAGCSLDTEGIGRKSQEKEGSRFCTEVAVGEPIGRLRFVLSSCLPLRLTNRWPVPQEPYRQEPFLVDEDRIGRSAIIQSLQYLVKSVRFISTVDITGPKEGVTARPNSVQAKSLSANGVSPSECGSEVGYVACPKYSTPPLDFCVPLWQHGCGVAARAVAAVPVACGRPAQRGCQRDGGLTTWCCGSGRWRPLTEHERCRG